MNMPASTPPRAQATPPPGTPSRSSSLAPSDLEWVRRLVRERAAIVLDAGKDYLIEARLSPVARAEGFESTGKFVSRLRSMPPQGRLVDRVVEAMTTNETSWYRDVQPFSALEREVLPALIRERAASRYLTIWSAACSSGQEPYTIAMVLREKFPQLSSWNVRIIASDISADMLGRAVAGRYSQIEVNRGLPAPMLVKYFQRDGTDWVVRDDIRGMVEFRSLNLIKPWGVLPPVDIAFLRNVLIYFDVATKRSILAKMYQQLRPDGVLFLGTAETTLNLDSRFERVAAGPTSYYRRPA